MYKSCAKCGKIHDINYQCGVKRIYIDTEEKRLRSQYAWTKKSKEIRERANNLCEVCRDKGVYTYDNIEVHHITKIKDDKTKLLDNYNLICLCSEHHKLSDAYEIEPSYLEELARKREEE